MLPTVVIADDHPVVTAGLRRWFEGAVEVVGEAPDGVSAAELVLSLGPDLLLTEVSLPKRDGLECLRRLREEGDPTPVLVYTAHDNPTYAARASALGAVGCLPKSTPREALIDAVHRAARGEACWDEPVSKRVAGALNGAGATLASQLTGREHEVLKQLSFGLSNKEIALALGISYETVKEHVQHILRKLGVADRTQAAVWAVRQGVA